MLASFILRRPSIIPQNRAGPLILTSTAIGDGGKAGVTGGEGRNSATSLGGGAIEAVMGSHIDSDRSWYPTPKKRANFAARRRRVVKERVGGSGESCPDSLRRMEGGWSDFGTSVLLSSWSSVTTKEVLELERLRRLEGGSGGKERMFASESCMLSSTGVIETSSRFVIWNSDEGGSVPKT